VGSGFDQLGWSPEGEVFFMYGVNWPGPGATAGAFTAAAEGDLDADTTFSQFGYVHPAGPTAASAVAAPFGPCPNTGTYDAGTAANDLLNTVGPCRPTDGQSIF